MKELKYPVSIYDEPAEYNSFSGGINTDRNDLGILQNQLKHAENLHLENGNLHVRKGGKKILEFETSIPLSNMQGVFLFVYKRSYIIVANDGKLYKGLYQPNAKVTLSPLEIVINESEIEKSSNKLSEGLRIERSQDQTSQNHDGFVFLNGGLKTLIFQNKYKVEAIQYKNKLYMTTGTRFIEISEMYIGELTARIVEAYKPNGVEYSSIGPNLLSYVPSLHINHTSVSVKTSISGVIPQLLAGAAFVRIQAIMTYQQGETAKDYSFKWERTSDGINYKPVEINNSGNKTVPCLFKEEVSTGKDSFIVSEEEAKKYKYRCTFGKSFKQKYDPETGKSSWMYDETEYEDLIIDKTDGYWFGMAESVQYTDEIYSRPNDYYMQIQTCKKIFGYGNKFILYDDAYNSGNFWKTIIDNPSYITHRGGLNFKTDKDEQLIKVINFKGVIVCFAFNDVLGGNISVVSGNGDDYNDGSGNFSPFTRRIVNKEITTDNAYSVQVADNIIIFKYRESIFAIEGSELNYEIVNVTEINTHVKQGNRFFKIPFYDNNCISERNDTFYALYWKDSYDLDGNLIHPACRLKLYYKEAYQDNGRLYFPFLLDTSELFNTDFIIMIEGKTYSTYNDKLISFHEDYYKDLDKEYEFNIVTRSYELNYPQFIKSVRSLMVAYAHDQASDVVLSYKIYNEAMYEMLKTANRKIESNALNNNNAIIKLDDLFIFYELLTARLREDCMSATVEIKGTATGDFVLSSLMFFYKTKSIPRRAPIEKYKRTVRKGERLVK